MVSFKEGDKVTVHVHAGPRTVYNGLAGRIIRIYEKMFFGYRVKFEGIGIDGFTKEELRPWVPEETSSGDEPG